MPARLAAPVAEQSIRRAWRSTGWPSPQVPPLKGFKGLLEAACSSRMKAGFQTTEVARFAVRVAHACSSSPVLASAGSAAVPSLVGGAAAAALSPRCCSPRRAMGGANFERRMPSSVLRQFAELLQCCPSCGVLGREVVAGAARVAVLLGQAEQAAQRVGTFVEPALQCRAIDQCGVMGEDKLAGDVVVVGQKMTAAKPSCAFTNKGSFTGCTLRFSPRLNAAGTPASAWSTCSRSDAAWSWSGRAFPQCATSTSRCTGRPVPSRASSCSSRRCSRSGRQCRVAPRRGAAMPDARGVVGVKRQRHRAAQRAEIELQRFVGCHGVRSLGKRSGQDRHAAEGSQSTNRNEPVPGCPGNGGLARAIPRG